ncbi:hypothetical protein IT157_00375 [bacterium]|nr:hypothetical protein [bacterium]
MRYIPNTPDDRIAMLRDIGVSSLEELLSPIPQDLRLNRPIKLPDGASEWEVRRDITAMARKNINATLIPSFMGAGAYDHYVPSAINAVAMRSELVTAYTT